MVSPGDYLGFLSIDKWTIIFNLINTFILYKIIKKFLFKPVNKIINDRKIEIENSYNEVEKALNEANDLKSKYKIKVENSKKEAMDIIESAKIKAEKQSDYILKNAEEKANKLIEKANQEIKLGSKKALNDIKDDVADIVVLAASKIIEREIYKDGHKEVIDKIFDEAKIG